MPKKTNKLWDLVAQRYKHKALAGREAAIVTELDQKIIPLLQADGVKSVESLEAGYQVTLTEGANTEYSLDELLRLIPRKQLLKWGVLVVEERIDKDALLAAVNSKKISRKILKKISNQTPKKPYITVTPRS